jgi:hypothetical protein
VRLAELPLDWWPKRHKLRLMQSENAALIAMVCAAPVQTITAGTARILYEIRAGASDGPANSVQRTEPGFVDFKRRRVYYTSTVVTRHREDPIETLWIEQRLFSRPSSSDPWKQLRPMGWLEPGAMPFGAPLWLLAALCGTEAASEVGLEEVRGVATTRCRLIVNCSQAQERSPWRLGFPRAPAETFPAEVWLDPFGRITRMGCDWQPSTDSLRRGYLRRHVERSSKRRSWIVTELWDFGTDAIMLPGAPDEL